MYISPPLPVLLFDSEPPLDDSNAVSPDAEDKQDEGKMEKHKKKKGNGIKVARPKHNKERGYSLFYSFFLYCYLIILYISGSSLLAFVFDFFSKSV